VQRRNLTPALEKYIVVPDGVDFATMLGERGVFVGPVGGGRKAARRIMRMTTDSKGWIELEVEELFTDGEVEVASDAEDDDVDVQMSPPPASEGLANGIQEVEVLEELGMDVQVADVQEEEEPPTKKSRPKPKPITKSPKPNRKPASESESESYEEQDEQPSKTSKAKARGSPVKKRLPISSAESGASDESVARHQEEEEVVERLKRARRSN